MINATKRPPMTLTAKVLGVNDTTPDHVVATAAWSVAQKYIDGGCLNLMGWYRKDNAVFVKLCGAMGGE